MTGRPLNQVLSGIKISTGSVSNILKEWRESEREQSESNRVTTFVEDLENGYPVDQKGAPLNWFTNGSEIESEGIVNNKSSRVINAQQNKEEPNVGVWDEPSPTESTKELVESPRKCPREPEYIELETTLIIVGFLFFVDVQLLQKYGYVSTVNWDKFGNDT